MKSAFLQSSDQNLISRPTQHWTVYNQSEGENLRRNQLMGCFISHILIGHVCNCQTFSKCSEKNCKKNTMVKNVYPAHRRVALDLYQKCLHKRACWKNEHSTVEEKVLPAKQLRKGFILLMSLPFLFTPHPCTRRPYPYFKRSVPMSPSSHPL